MTNIFLAQPGLLEHATAIKQVRPHEGGGFALAVHENIARPAGGGQPADRGALTLEGHTLPLEAVLKRDGETWLVVYGLVGPPTPGTPVALSVDAPRRQLLSRGHSLTHLLMAAIRQRMPGYESKGADLSEDGGAIQLRFRCDAKPTAADLTAIDRQTRSWIARDLPVEVAKARGVEEARALFPEWRVDPDLGLSGRIRVIRIRDVDANPCSGSHVVSTGAAGPYDLGDPRQRPDGVVVLNAKVLNAWAGWYGD